MAITDTSILRQEATMRAQLEEREFRMRQRVERDAMRRISYAIHPLDETDWSTTPPWFATEPSPDLSGAPRSEPDRKLIPRFGVALADESESDHQLAKEAEALLGYSVLRRKLKIAGKLGEVLACLDIEPLNFEAVEQYKSQMVLWRRKEIAERAGAYARTHRIDVSWKRSPLAQCEHEVPLFALRKAVQVKKACADVILEVDELHEEKILIDPFLVARLNDETYYLEVWKEPKFEETL